MKFTTSILALLIAAVSAQVCPGAEDCSGEGCALTFVPAKTW